jgi:hypothetical protein
MVSLVALAAQAYGFTEAAADGAVEAEAVADAEPDAAAELEAVAPDAVALGAALEAVDEAAAEAAPDVAGALLVPLADELEPPQAVSAVAATRLRATSDGRRRRKGSSATPAAAPRERFIATSWSGRSVDGALASVVRCPGPASAAIARGSPAPYRMVVPCRPVHACNVARQ